jgi:hypothetical protein
MASCRGGSDGDDGNDAEDAAATSPSRTSFVIVSYTRKTLGQTGDGHFSPVGGYDRATDSILILDVARFKYPPHWVPVEMMWEAGSTIVHFSAQPKPFWSRLPVSPCLIDWGEILQPTHHTKCAYVEPKSG